MNSSRATVGIAIVFLAAALSLAAIPRERPAAPAFSGDPSVPSATAAFREGDAKTAAQGNVVDMAY
jgi:hypothetical protein